MFLNRLPNQLVYGNSEEGNVSSEVVSIFQSPEILQWSHIKKNFMAQFYGWGSTA